MLLLIHVLIRYLISLAKTEQTEVIYIWDSNKYIKFFYMEYTKDAVPVTLKHSITGPSPLALKQLTDTIKHDTLIPTGMVFIFARGHNIQLTFMEVLGIIISP